MDPAAPPNASPLSASGSNVAPPVIGVTPSLDAGRRLRPGSDYWYLNRNYTRALANAGAAPLVLCPDTPIDVCLAQCEGLVLSGGGDLPMSFASNPAEHWQETVPGEAESGERIAWERELLQAFADRGRAVLGVCFGMQLMNLHFGGTLELDLSRRAVPGLDHGGGGVSQPHALRIATGSAFFGDWRPPPKVSSQHRQAVAKVAPGFEAVAWADDGVVEAIERGLLLGVEWHPEGDASGSFVYSRWIAQILKQR
jgi:putative glutamine amidotransferase